MRSLTALTESAGVSASTAYQSASSLLMIVTRYFIAGSTLSIGGLTGEYQCQWHSNSARPGADHRGGQQPSHGAPGRSRPGLRTLDRVGQLVQAVPADVPDFRAGDLLGAPPRPAPGDQPLLGVQHQPRYRRPACRGRERGDGQARAAEPPAAVEADGGLKFTKHLAGFCLRLTAAARAPGGAEAVHILLARIALAAGHDVASSSASARCSGLSAFRTRAGTASRSS